MTPNHAFRAVRCVNHDGRLVLSVEHWVERRGETLMTAREAGTPTRLARSNPLLSMPGGASALRHHEAKPRLPLLSGLQASKELLKLLSQNLGVLVQAA